MNPCGTLPSTGTILLRADPLTPTVYTAMAGVRTMPQYVANAETAECAGFAVSATGYKKKYKNGVFDQDDMPLELDFMTRDPGQLKIKEDFDSLDAVGYRIALPDANSTTLSVACNVISWGIGIPDGGEAISRPVTLQPADDPVYVE